MSQHLQNAIMSLVYAGICFWGAWVVLNAPPPLSRAEYRGVFFLFGVGLFGLWAAADMERRARRASR